MTRSASEQGAAGLHAFATAADSERSPMGKERALILQGSGHKLKGQEIDQNTVHKSDYLLRQARPFRHSNCGGAFAKMLISSYDIETSVQRPRCSKRIL